MKTMQSITLFCASTACRSWNWTGRTGVYTSAGRGPSASTLPESALVWYRDASGSGRLASLQVRRKWAHSRTSPFVAQSVAPLLARGRCAPVRMCVGSDSDARKRPDNGRERKPRVLSGVQPTGRIHLGNYLGAIQQWVTHQYDYDSWFCVVDMHAITVPQDPRQLAEDTLSTAAMYLACGLDPAHCRIFVQSQVPAHAELAWLLNCITPMGWLEKMTQYKDKRQRLGDDAPVNLGLFAYPVLMAADILLYRAERVPVGEDQRQHLELTRDIARTFNHTFCRKRKPHKLPSVFREPEALILPEGLGVSRVMSLTDGTSKMSKSAPSDMSRINLLDDADTIRNKIRRCKTDTERHLRFDDPSRPECNNLLHIYRAITGNRPKSDIERELETLNPPGWAGFKELLAEALISLLGPIQERYHQFRNERLFLEEVLARGREEANLVANETLRAAKEAMGFAVASEARGTFTEKDGSSVTARGMYSSSSPSPSSSKL
ncbi:hypothetical protein CCYA_CCYA19G4743 [Cyanidiococcus yangmingshanensis]|nr:hypothetical protein CCYA_CCYA19G4743 [Cyanidiococcus yangmingshanensis]